MAPILSKVKPPPPRSTKEASERFHRKTRPLLESFLDIVQESLENGHYVYSKTAEKLNRWSDRLVTTSMWLLENFCCVDLAKFAKGPGPKLSGSLPIMFCLMMLGMLYNAFVCVYMPAAGLAFNSPTSLIFHAFTFLCLASFVQATRVDPGGIPPGPEWRTQGSPPECCTERKHGSSEARWCRKSEAYKPDRAHFCRALNKPVLRMDHHCPWLGNTIGWANHKYFYLFLGYTCGACSMLWWDILQLLIHATLPALSSFLLIGAEGLTLLLSSIMIPFFLFHTWLIARNMTTIEFCAKFRPKSEGGEAPSAGEAEQEPHHRLKSKYDIGVYNNFCAVLGDNPLLWFLPVGTPTGDGLNFPSAFERDAQEPLHRRLSRQVISTVAGFRPSNGEAPTSQADDPEADHPPARAKNSSSSSSSSSSTASLPASSSPPTVATTATTTATATAPPRVVQGTWKDISNNNSKRSSIATTATTATTATASSTATFMEATASSVSASVAASVDLNAQDAQDWYGEDGEGDYDEDYWEEDWAHSDGAVSQGTESQSSVESKLSKADAESFLGWTSAAEFVDDLRVGCITIEETLENVALTVASICGPNKARMMASQARQSAARRNTPLLDRPGRPPAGRSTCDGSISGPDFFSD